MPSSSLRPGHVLEVTIEKGVYRGLGLARHEGEVVFVPRAVPGDRLRVRVASVERGYARAALERVLEGGPGRREAPCPRARDCGGCSYQVLEYVEQLRLKQAILRESLVRAGVAWEREVPVAPSPETGWRTRATFHLAWVGDELRLGLHEEARHRVVDLRRCPQVSDAMNRVLGELRPRLRASWQVSKRIASVVLAESGDGGRLVACVDGDLATADLPALVALGEVPGLSGFGALAGPQEARRFAGLRGEPYVEATVGGLRLRAHALSFFQSNRFLLEPLVRCVAELVPAGGRLLDLYAGAGLFALSLAPGRDEVLGIEGNGQSVEDARANAEAAGMRHVRFEAVEVREALLARPPAPDERVVLDPPRTGAGTDVARAVCARRPEAVVYVSCDPPTLGRDLKAFLAGGYRIEAVRAFDMFPDTFHLETVVKLLPA